jgi:hypothetical protein
VVIASCQNFPATWSRTIKKAPFWGAFFIAQMQSPQLTQAIVTCPNAIPLTICPAHSIWRHVGRRAFGAWARIRDWVYARTEGRISMVWCSICLRHIRAPKRTCALRLLPATGLTRSYLFSGKHWYK